MPFGRPSHVGGSTDRSAKGDHTPLAKAPLLCDRSRAGSRLRIRRSTMTILACAYEAPRHRAGMLAAFEDRNARRKRRFISFDPLHETPAAGRHVVHELRLVQAQTVEVDDVHVGAQARHKPAAIR